MRISDWSSDVCSSDLVGIGPVEAAATEQRIDADAQHQEGADGEDRDQGLDEVFHAPRILRRPAGLNRPGDAITRQSVAVIGRGLPQGQPLRASSRRRAIPWAWISAAPSKLLRMRASHQTRPTGYY